ncbi:MAG: hypothetical protein HZB50_02260 [Chloroflexi bacterium]|nr:hypothetical protein [Chloroflexota bacterium]
MDGQYFSFLHGPIREEKDVDEFMPELLNEFDHLYIRSLASRYHDQQIKLNWRIRLSKFGSWLISLGHYLQHMAHLPFEARHASWKTVALQSVKIRHHR